MHFNHAVALPRGVANGPIWIIGISACISAGYALAGSASTEVIAALVALAVVIGTLVDVQLLLYGVVAAMLLSPEVAVGNVGSRALTLRIEDLIIPLAALAILGRRIVHPRERIELEPLLIPFLAVTGARIISTLLAVRDDLVVPSTAAFFVLKQIEYFLVYYLALNGPRRSRDADRLLATLFATALTVAAISSMQIGALDRLTAPFEGKPEPNTLGGYLVFVMALLTGFLLEHPSKRTRFWSALAILGLAVPMLFTLSRASYLAAIAIAGCVVLIRRRATAAFAIAVGIALIVVLAPDVVQDRVLSTASIEREAFGSHLVLEASAASKLTSWVWIKIAYATRPFFGWGTTGAGLVDVYYPLAFAEGGLFGIAAFLWLQFAVFRLAQRGRRSHDPGTRALGTGFLVGWVGLLVHSFGANTFLIVRIMEPFWFAAGLLAFRLHAESRRAAALAVEAPTPEENTVPATAGAAR